MEPVSLGIRMTIKLEGLTSTQVDSLHQVARETKTQTKQCGERVNLPGDGINFIEITKSELKSPNGLYSVILTIYPTLEGWIYPPLPGNDRRWARVSPSRNGIDQIFEAVGILPPDDTIEDRPVPTSHGGR